MATTLFAFDLILATPEGAMGEGAPVDALLEVGCGDAVVGLGRSGLIGVLFSREGADTETVIQTAVDEALNELPEGASLSEVRPGIG